MPENISAAANSALGQMFRDPAIVRHYEDYEAGVGSWDRVIDAAEKIIAEKPVPPPLAAEILHYLTDTDAWFSGECIVVTH